MKLTLILNSIIITLFSVLFFSCNRDNECDTVISHYASDQVKNYTDPIAPLTSYDTLRFLYNDKDTQIYVGQGVQSGWVVRSGNAPNRCDNRYEHLIYTYNCINAAGFNFRLEYYPYRAVLFVNQNLNRKCYFKNVYVGDYSISTLSSDSIEINKHWYKEPYYISNGPDTMQYFMLSGQPKNPNVLFLKIKYLNNELTLIK